jgi:hypothetical protein
MDGDIQALLALIATLVGVVAFVVRSQMIRNDRNAQAGLEHMEKLHTLFERVVDGFERSVNNFEAFRAEEVHAHQALMESDERQLGAAKELAGSQETMAEIQAVIAKDLAAALRILERLEGKIDSWTQ